MKRYSDEIAEKMINEVMDFGVKVTKILERDTRYLPEAYGFIMAALNYRLSKLKKRRHISGRELLDGIRRYALHQFGPMTRTVLEHWGIKTTMDFGEIVFNLVDSGLMRKRTEDDKEEFRNVFDFESAFERPYRLSATPRIAAWKPATGKLRRKKG